MQNLWLKNVYFSEQSSYNVQICHMVSLLGRSLSDMLSLQAPTLHNDRLHWPSIARPMLEGLFGQATPKHGRLCVVCWRGTSQ